MSLQIILKNSSVSGKEPTASQLANGELALNYHADGPFISCKDSAGTVRRIAGVWISTTAPTSPQPGEFWLDTNTDPAKLKVYKDGTDTWIDTITVVAASTTTAGIVELATNAETQTGTDTLRAVTPASLQSKVSDSTTTTSSTTIASSTAVKSAKDVADAALPAAGGTISGNLTVSGDLTVNGTTTTIDTTTLIVEDKNIEMGAVGTPTDVTADGGGITLKGATDKTLNWVDSTDSWTSSENVDLASGKTYKIAGTDVLSGTTLGSGVTGSSLTSVGTITSGTWNGTQIATAYIADDAVTADKLANTAVTAGSYTAADITVDAQGRITAAASGTIGTAEIADGAVTSAKIADGTIVNADVSASAAIAGTKIDADFGAQDLSVDGNIFYVDATNNRVGVGTSSPNERFTVSGGDMQLRGSTYTDFSDYWGSGDNAALFLPYGFLGSSGDFNVSLYANGYRNTTPGFTYMGIDGNTATAAGIDLDPEGKIFFRTGAATGNSLPSRMYIDSAGNVGINTSSPDTLLHLSSATGSATPTPTELRIASTTNASDWSTTDPWGRISFYSSDTSGTGPKIHAAIDAISQDAFKGVSSLNFRTSLTDGTLPVRMTINNVGNVGVGTTTPGSLLHVSNGNDSASGEFIGLTIGGTNVNNARTGSLIKDTTTYDLIYKNNNFSSAVGSHIFQNGDYEHARIDSSGRFLIGTPSVIDVPDGEIGTIRSPGFQRAGTSFANTINSIAFFNPISSGAGCLAFTRSNTTTVGAHAIAANGDRLGTIGFSASDGTDYEEAATITAEVDGATGTNTMPGRLVFSTTSTTAGASPTERMRIDSSGRLLVGTASATTGYVLSGSFTNETPQNQFVNSSRAGLVVQRTNGPGTAILASGQTAANDTGTGTLLFSISDGTKYLPTASIFSQVNGTPGTNDMPGSLRFGTTQDGASSPTERAAIDSSGRLLIGTNSARENFLNASFSAALQVEGTGHNDSSVALIRNTNNSGAGYLNFAKSRGGSLGSNTLVADNDTLGVVSFQGADGTQFVEAAQIRCRVDGTPGADDMPGLLEFSTTADGASSPSERMRIDSRGNIFANSASRTSTIWGTTNVVFDTGYVGTNGSYGMDIVGNGYRNTSGGWTSMNNDSQTGRTIISLRPEGEILFGADQSSTGTEPLSRMSVNWIGRTAHFGDSETLRVRTALATNSTGVAIRLQAGATSITTGGSTTFQVSASGNILNQNNVYGQLSDIKLKENIVDANSQWDDLKALRVRNYNFKEGQTHTQIGLIAQEVESVSPGLVQENYDYETVQVPLLDANGDPVLDDEGNEAFTTEDRATGEVTKAVNYSVLYMKAVKALQEAMERIETLEQRLTDAGL